MCPGKSRDQENTWDKWEALAGDVCPGTGFRGDGKSQSQDLAPRNHRTAGEKELAAASSSGRTFTLLVSFGGVLGLGLGITFAMLLVSGELDLSLKEIRVIVKTFKGIFP